MSIYIRRHSFLSMPDFLAPLFPTELIRRRFSLAGRGQNSKSEVFSLPFMLVLLSRHDIGQVRHGTTVNEIQNEYDKKLSITQDRDRFLNRNHEPTNRQQNRLIGTALLPLDLILMLQILHLDYILTLYTLSHYLFPLYSPY